MSFVSIHFMKKYIMNFIFYELHFMVMIFILLGTFKVKLKMFHCTFSAKKSYLT